MENNIENKTENTIPNNLNNKKEKSKVSVGIVITLVIMTLIIGVLIGAIVGVAINKSNQTHTCNETPKSQNRSRDGIPYAEKPIIYLYPQEKTELTVTLGKPENLTCSYPEYKNGWNVVANPDGTLVDKESGRELYSLYWEGLQTEPVNMEEGFVVKGTDTAKFLEEKLAILGLTDKEAEEFIVYWLPELQNNEYNYIRFATIDEINTNMPLDFSVNPDTLIRVLMQYKPLDEKIEVREQKLETPARSGFVAVEWGGTEIK